MDDRKRASILRRVAKHGLRVCCAGCALEQRHKPADGRLRDARCKLCNRKALRTIGWIAEHADRWHQLVSEQAAITAPFARLGR